MNDEFFKQVMKIMAEHQHQYHSRAIKRGLEASRQRKNHLKHHSIIMTRNNHEEAK